MNRISKAYVHITHDCNMDCIGCNIIKTKDSNEPLELDKLLDVITNLKALGLKDLILTGGEPFAREDILDICKHIKTRIGVGSLTIITNGSFEFSRYEHAIPYIDGLIISIDGYNTNTGFLRDASNMAQVLYNISKLKNLTDCSLRVKIHKKNKEHINDYVDLSKRLGIYTSFNIMNLNKNDKLYDDYILNNHDLMDISHSLLETEEVIDPIKTRTNQINVFCDSRCKMGCESVSIDVNGDIYPCRLLKHESLRLGNILEDSFIKTININEAVSNKLDADNINECRDCEYKCKCQGGCRARSLHHNGTIYEPDIYCEFLKKYFKIKMVQLKQSI